MKSLNTSNSQARNEIPNKVSFNSSAVLFPLCSYLIKPFTDSTAPDSENPRKRKLTSYDDRRKQFVFKCETCELFYKQLRSVIESQVLNGD